MTNDYNSERLQRLVAQNRGFLSAFLRRLGVRDSDADDVAQSVFFLTAQKLAVVKEGSERAFLRSVAWHKVRHLRRKFARRREVSDDDVHEVTPASIQQDALILKKRAHEIANQLVTSMQEDMRLVFQLVELEGKTTRDAAQKLGIPLGTAKTRLRRARAWFQARATLRD
jgi:RNA polymerase sigma-70 factor (ECF subfamily)